MRTTPEASMRTLAVGALLAALAGGIALPAVHGEERPGISALSKRPGKPVIARAWHGRTLRAKADEYEKYLSAAITKFPSIPGNLGYQLLRIDGGADGDAYSEFQVISYWESLEAIRGYAGTDIQRTHDLPRDHEFLIDPEPYVRNYELRVDAIRP
jgi:heme-degrading monooxygenase HmoA